MFCELLLSRRHERLQISQDRIKGIRRSNSGNDCSCFDCPGMRFSDERQDIHWTESTAGTLVLSRRFDGLAHGQDMGIPSSALRMVSPIRRIPHLGTLGQGRHWLHCRRIRSAQYPAPNRGHQLSGLLCSLALFDSFGRQAK